MFDTLISTDQLAQRLAAPALVVIDCRFDLARPEWGMHEYAQARIPSARYAHLDRDLSGPLSDTSGRHPLPTPQALAKRLSQWGIGPDSQVVIYDQGPGAYAARLWWLLHWLGHRYAAVLDGGLTAWRDAGLALQSTAPPVPVTRTFNARANGRLIAETGQIERAVAAGLLQRGQPLLIDARAAARFAGEHEPIDPVAGHIPGARNHPFSDNLANGRFLEATTLRSRFEHTLQGRDASEVVCMCGSGVTACHNLLALQISGQHDARLYAGSWSEWIRDPARPVALGA